MINSWTTDRPAGCTGLWVAEPGGCCYKPIKCVVLLQSSVVIVFAFARLFFGMCPCGIAPAGRGVADGHYPTSGGRMVTFRIHHLHHSNALSAGGRGQLILLYYSTPGIPSIAESVALN
uniref:Uncharacterized protein n=1 Tax=Arundo donax TaxID=35708 RepID=A0A0A8ZJS5_ARUDO